MTDSNKPKSPRPARRRARKDDGSFRADNPATPHNEAWEAVDISEAVTPKPKPKNLVKPQVSGKSDSHAGKYAKKSKLRPTFGKVHTTYN